MKNVAGKPSKKMVPLCFANGHILAALRVALQRMPVLPEDCFLEIIKIDALLKDSLSMFGEIVKMRNTLGLEFSNYAEMAQSISNSVVYCK